MVPENVSLESTSSTTSSPSLDPAVARRGNREGAVIALSRGWVAGGWHGVAAQVWAQAA